MESTTSEYLGLNKKLGITWSSGSLCRQLSLQLLEEINTNFHTLEKKVKMRILLSFLGLDASRRGELSQSLLRLLRLAAEEEKSEVWVAITSHLVHERIFGGVDDEAGYRSGSRINNNINGGTGIGGPSWGSNGNRDNVLSGTSATIIQNLIEWSSKDNSDESSSYFKPLEFKFLSTTWIAKMLMESTVNSDFHFVGAVPDFIGREKQRVRLNKQEGAQQTSLMRVNIETTNHHQLTLGVNNNRSVAEVKKAKVPLHLGGGQRSTSKLISLDDIKAKKEKEKDEKSIVETKGGKRKAPGGGSTDDPELKLIKTETGVLSDAIAATGTAPFSVRPTVETVEALPAVATMEVAEGQVQPLDDDQQLHSKNFSMDVDALFSESPLLTPEDKDIITVFFSDNWRATLAGDNPPRRMKLSEADTADGKRKTMYLVLNFAEHSYMKTAKMKKKSSALK